MRMIIAGALIANVVFWLATGTVPGDSKDIAIDLAIYAFLAFILLGEKQK